MAKYEIIEKRPFKGDKRSNGRGNVHLGTICTTTDGVEITFLTPAGKGAKYARELKDNKRYTNSGVEKTDMPLTNCGKAYRSGYLRSRSDNAAVYKAKHKK
jgi:hypothetical protein